MTSELNSVQKYVLDGALTLWVEAFNAEREAADGKLYLFGADYAAHMADDIRRQLNIDKDGI